MPIETFDDLSGRSNDDTVKNAALQTLHAMYYGDNATSPDDVAQFTEQAQRLLTDTYNLGTDDTEAVLAVLTEEISTNHGGSPARLAMDLLPRSGWLSTEEIFSDAAGMFQEMWLDEATGLYYDTLGNWYDANRQPLPAQASAATPDDAPQMWLDETTGLYYDAQGNWYDADRRPIPVEVPTAPAEPVPTAEATPSTEDTAPVADDENATHEDSESLLWVTSEQQTQLDELTVARGEWAAWLPEELDARWPGWRATPGDELTKQLDSLIPFLLMPAEDAVELDQVVDRFVDEALVPALEQLDPDLVAELSQEDIEEVVAGILTEELSEAGN